MRLNYPFEEVYIDGTRFESPAAEDTIDGGLDDLFDECKLENMLGGGFVVLALRFQPPWSRRERI